MYFTQKCLVAGVLGFAVSAALVGSVEAARGGRGGGRSFGGTRGGSMGGRNFGGGARTFGQRSRGMNSVPRGGGNAFRGHGAGSGRRGGANFGGAAQRFRQLNQSHNFASRGMGGGASGHNAPGPGQTGHPSFGRTAQRFSQMNRGMGHSGAMGGGSGRMNPAQTGRRNLQSASDALRRTNSDFLKHYYRPRPHNSGNSHFANGNQMASLSRYNFGSGVPSTMSPSYFGASSTPAYSPSETESMPRNNITLVPLSSILDNPPSSMPTSSIEPSMPTTSIEPSMPTTAEAPPATIPAVDPPTDDPPSESSAMPDPPENRLIDSLKTIINSFETIDDHSQSDGQEEAMIFPGRR
jgi:hypothetical protein